MKDSVNFRSSGMPHANPCVEEVYFQSVMALSAAVEAKDPYTRGHCDRVAYLFPTGCLAHGKGQGLCKTIVISLILILLMPFFKPIYFSRTVNPWTNALKFPIWDGCGFMMRLF